MKKVVSMAIILFVIACSNTNMDNQNVINSTQVTMDYLNNENSSYVNTSYTGQEIASMPCTYIVPEVTVLKPRALEKKDSKKKRPCCDIDDNTSDNADFVIPHSPEIYIVAANRAFGQMYQVLEGLKGNVFVNNAIIKEKDLPTGAENSTDTIKRKIALFDGLTVVDDETKATYILTPEIDWFDTSRKKVPAIKYSISLKSEDGGIDQTWSEVMHQAEGDRSWW